MLAYAYTLRPDDDGSLIVEVPDFPGALTAVARAEEAPAGIADALKTLIRLRMKHGQEVPLPRKRGKGGRHVDLPSLVAVKVALHHAMLAAGVTVAELGRRLGVKDHKATSRLLDPYHNSRMDHLDAALAAVGADIEITPRRAA